MSALLRRVPILVRSLPVRQPATTPWTFVQGWRLHRRVTALVMTVSIVLLLLAGGAASAAAVTRAQLDLLLNVVGPLRNDAPRLLAALLNQETGIRGYALTHDPASLGPYRTGLAEEQRLAAEMDRLLTEYPSISVQLRAVEDQARRWRQQVAEPAIAAIAAGGAGAGQVLATSAARQQFDQIRAAAAELQDTLLELRTRISDRVGQAANALVVLLIIAAVVVLLAGAALLVLLHRLVNRPITELAVQVRAVAQGAYTQQISTNGPSEITELAQDMDAMRRKIAADLAELEAKADELTRSNRDLEQFAYVASHDLQEPLRKVASFCQLLKRRYAGQLDERADQYISFAVDGAERMQRLINDLLAFSRIGRVTSGFVEVDLNRLVADVVAQLDKVRARSHGKITWTGLPVVHGEESLLATLLTNLLGNSLKFRRSGTPPRVRLSARQVGDDWEITCADNGIGIEPEFADKVFVIFQRLHSKDAYPGTGIGLAIAKKIVEYHGGRIWVDPEYSDGTAICFTLPVVPARAEAGNPAEPINEAGDPVADSAKESLV